MFLFKVGPPRFHGQFDAHVVLVLMFLVPIIILAGVLGIWRARMRDKIQFGLSQLFIYNFALGVAIGLQVLCMNWFKNAPQPALWCAGDSLSVVYDRPWLTALAAMLWMVIGHVTAQAFASRGKLTRPMWWACAVCVAGSMLYMVIVASVDVLAFRGRP